jgi:hypothetical protein
MARAAPPRRAPTRMARWRRGATESPVEIHQGRLAGRVLLGRRYLEGIAAEVNVPGKPDPARTKDVILRHGLVPA